MDSVKGATPVGRAYAALRDYSSKDAAERRAARTIAEHELVQVKADLDSAYDGLSFSRSELIGQFANELSTVAGVLATMDGIDHDGERENDEPSR